MEIELESLQQELEALAARSEALQAEAFDRGRREAIRELDLDADKRLDLLREAMSQAHQAFADNNIQVELLALQLAKAALQRILGEACDKEERLQQAIDCQLERFAASRPMALRISATDFPDEKAISKLAANWPELKVIADRKLAEGECRLALELGEVDLGVAGQVERLTRLFDTLSAERVRATQADLPVHAGQGGHA